MFHFDSTSIIIIVVIGFLFVYFVRNVWHPGMVYEKSKMNQKYYLVRNRDDKEDAANVLAFLDKSLRVLVTRLQMNYRNNQDVQRLAKRFEHTVVQESSSTSSSTSYSLNKGSLLVFCIREKSIEQKIIPLNTLMFVALHELAHLMTVSFGHTDEFWNNMRYLVAHAIHWNMYRYEDYSKNPKKFCGTIIRESPVQPGDQEKYIEFDEDQPETKLAPIPKPVTVKGRLYTLDDE